LLPVEGTLLINSDSPEADQILQRARADRVRIGLQEGNDWQAKFLEADARGTTFEVRSPLAAYGGTYRLGLLGRHQVTNALLAIVIGARFALERAEIERGLLSCPPARGRLQLWEADGLGVLDDTYNANADSMRAALQTLVDLPCAGRRMAVLGEMHELGKTSEAAHAEVGRYAAELGVERLFAVGRLATVMTQAARAAHLAGASGHETVEDAAAAVIRFAQPGDLVLLKASRAARLERIAERLRCRGRTGATSSQESPAAWPNMSRSEEASEAARRLA